MLAGSDYLLGVFLKSAGLRKHVERFLHLGIFLGVDPQTALAAELGDEQLGLDVAFHPLVVLHQVSFGISDFFLIEELAELAHYFLINHEVFGELLAQAVVLGKVEKGVMAQQFVLKVIGLGGIVLHVGRDAAAAVHSASAVGKLDLVAGIIPLVLAGVVVVVE